MKHPLYRSLAFSSLVLFSASAYGAPFSVTSTLDSGPGSLRAGIAAVNSNTNDSIVFNLPANSTITLASSLLPIQNPNVATLVISNSPATPVTIDGNSIGQIFYVIGHNPVSISNLTLQNGLAKGGNGGQNSMSSVIPPITTNVAGGGGGGAGGGGGICAIAAAVSLQNIVFSSNSAVGGDGGGASPTTLVAGGSGGGGFNGGAGAPGTPADVGDPVPPHTFIYGGPGGGGGGDAGGGAGFTTPSSTGGGGTNDGGAGGNGTGGGGGGFGGVGFGAPNTGSGGGGGGGASFSNPGGPGAAGTNLAAGFGGTVNPFDRGGGGGGGAFFQPGTGAVGGDASLGGGGGGGGAGGQGGAAGGGGLLGGGGGGGAGGNLSSGLGGLGGQLGGRGANGNGTINGGGGGGGAALGGAIFIDSHTTFTLQDGSISGSSVTAGAHFGDVLFPPQAQGIDIFLVSEGQLNINVTSSLNLSNPINGNIDPIVTSNGVTKMGPGTLFLNGANTYNSATNVNAGTLVLNGSVFGTVSVANGGIFQGNASVLTNITHLGNLINSGIVSPGNSIGTINVDNNYTQNANGTLNIEIDPSGTTDLLAITGTASLDGSLVIFPDPGTYTTGQTFTFLTSAGGVSGTFASVMLNTNLGGRLIPTIVYDPNDVELIITVLPPMASFPTVSGNAQKVANCLDNTMMMGGADLTNVVSVLRTLSPTALARALNQLQPSMFGALSMTEQETAALVNASILDRLSTLYYCRSGRCASKKTSSTEQSQGAPAQKERYFFFFGTRPNNEEEASNTIEEDSYNKGTIWADGFYSQAHQQHYGQQPGFDTKNEGGVIGADYRLPHHIYLGAAGSYTYSDIDWNSSRGRAWINSGYGGLYGAWHNRHLFLATSVFGAYNRYSTKRHIDFSTIDRKARAHHNGYEVMANLDFGTNLCWKVMLFQPFDRVDYFYVHENGFKEHGAQSLDLEVSHKNSDMLRNELGVNIAFTGSLNKGRMLTPTFKCSWVREWRFRGKHYTTEIEGAGCVFSVDNNPPTRNFFSPGVGLSFVGCTTSLSALYEAELGHKYWQQAAKLNLQVSF